MNPNEFEDQGQEQDAFVKLLMVNPNSLEMPANMDKPKRSLTQYEKTQIEFQQTSQSLDVLLASWKFLETEGLLDEVDRIKIHKLRVDKLAELLAKL